MDIDGYPVTFWHAVDSGQPAPDASDLALLLRQFHSAGDDICNLPRLAPLSEVEDWLAVAHQVSPEHRQFLRGYAADLMGRYHRLTFELPQGPVHGDAHTGNLLGCAGAAVLIDFEAAATGPREWDLIPVAVAYKRLGLPRYDYEAFVEGYGFDVLRGIREVGMTTWLMQNVAESPRIEAEFELRVESMKNGDDTCVWHAF
ncbi:phosphotransferase [Micromonospora sp. CA-263727]|uniref:phosphotransferase n=1 Tax=Micromonospora sp. CA-263727 TaxID=3239967 RepID=UPI003D8AA5EE